MTLKEKFESIDQGKIKAEQVAFLQKIKTATKDFSLEDAVVNEKIESALDKMITAFKQSNPEAVKAKEVEKKEPSKEEEDEKAAQKEAALKKLEQKEALKKEAQRKQAEKKEAERKEAEEKEAERKEAEEKEAERKEAEEKEAEKRKVEEKKAEKKANSETEKLLKFIRRRKELKNIAGTDIMRDAKRQALPSGRRTSEDGNVYYENRENRTDRTQGSKTGWFLENGGAFGAGHFADGGELGQKKYEVQYNVGRAKYLVSFHDGIKKEKDGSDFYDIKIFKNKKDLEAFLNKLSQEGYRELRFNSSYSNGGAFGAGHFEKGGSVPNNYEGRTPEDIWSNWSSEQKIHFMQDHKYNIFGDRQISKEDREKFLMTKFEDLSRDLRIIVEDHVQEGQYANGGAFGAGHFEDGGTVDESIVDELWNGYASAVLFSETDMDSEESLDSEYSISDFDDETVSSTKKMLAHYYLENKDAIEESELDLDTIGNDIWYTRAGHGAGFFDHSLDEEVEEKLTKGAKALGEYPSVETYDGKVSIRGGRVFENGGAFGAGHFAEGGGISLTKDFTILKDDFQKRENEPNRVYHSIEGLYKGHWFKAETNNSFMSGYASNGINNGGIYQLDVWKGGNPIGRDESTKSEHIAGYFNKWDYRSMKKADKQIVSEIVNLIDENVTNSKRNLSSVKFADGGAFGAGHFAEGGLIGVNDIKKGAGFRNDIGNVFVIDEVNNGMVKYHSEKFGKENYEYDLDQFVDIMKAQRAVKMENGGAFGAGHFAKGGTLGKSLYVQYSSWFVSNKYDTDKMTSVLESIGAKNIRLENDRGWFNQPEVVVFNGDKDKAEKALNKAFETDWIMVSEKDWRKPRASYENGGAFGAGHFDDGGEVRTMSRVEPKNKKSYYELAEKHGVFPAAMIVESEDEDDAFVGRVSYLAKSSQDDSGIKGISREYAVDADDEEDALEEIKQMFLNEMSNAPFNRKKYEILEVNFKNKKMAMGGFTQIDLAGHSGGAYDFGSPTYLDNYTGTNYTGLVGETGALSSGEMFENGGEFNSEEINKSAKFYLDHSWSKKPTIENFEKEIKEFESLKTQLDNKEIRPSKIIGTGYKAGLSRKIAYEWLNKNIAIKKRAIELLKERESDLKSMANGGAFGAGRFNLGGETNDNPSRDRKFLNKSEDYEVKYAEGRNRRGYNK